MFESATIERICMGRCQRCHEFYLLSNGLCEKCRGDVEWLRVNRAMCAVLHRDSPARAADMADRQ